jgi:hypothetical protein
MPTFLSDPPRSLYIALAIVGVLSLLAAFFLVGKSPKGKDPKQKQSSPRKYLIALGLLALLALLGVYICDLMFESDREQIVRKLNEMSAAVRNRELDRGFNHLSESFRVQSTNKSQLRAIGDQALRSGEVTDIPIWDINFESLDSKAGTAVVNFRFKLNGPGIPSEFQWIGEATFVREADGQWRATAWRAFNFSGKKDPVVIPRL